MRKLPIAILICVALFLFGVVAVLMANSRGTKLSVPEPTPTKADYRIKEVHLQEERGGTRWQVDAEYGEIFEAQGKTVMKKVTIRIAEPSRQWTVSGDEGEMYQETKDVSLRGNVVVLSSDGLRLETERLNWAAKEQRAWTDEPVTIRRSGVVAQGRGFESRIKEGATTLKGRVRATINGNGMAGSKS